MHGKENVKPTLCIKHGANRQASRQQEKKADREHKRSPQGLLKGPEREKREKVDIKSQSRVDSERREKVKEKHMLIAPAYICKRC